MVAPVRPATPSAELINCLPPGRYRHILDSASGHWKYIGSLRSYTYTLSAMQKVCLQSTIVWPQKGMCTSGFKKDMVIALHLRRDSARGPGTLQAPAGSCGAGFSGMLAKLRTTPGSSGNAKESGPELLWCCAVS